MSRGMRGVSMMMRMQNRARNGAASRSRLETGAHDELPYPTFERSVNTHACDAKAQAV